MPNATPKQRPRDRAYTFFREKEGQRFSLQDFCDFTGYSLKTARNHFSKRWKDFASKISRDQFACIGLKGASKETFNDSLRQTWKLPIVAEITESRNLSAMTMTTLSIFGIVVLIALWRYRTRGIR